jgi:hypothetical protein
MSGSRILMKSDIDLDFGNRNEILSHIDYTPAVLDNGSKHLSGIYVTAVPRNPITDLASIDYKMAEDLGYFKIDILNQSVYKLVKSPEHLEHLLSREVNWSRLKDENFVKQLIHIGNYYDLISKLPQPITSIEELALFLAIIRPGKKYLQGLPWDIVRKTVWDRENTDGYAFRKSHALSYSILVTLHMAILEE